MPSSVEKSPDSTASTASTIPSSPPVALKTSKSVTKKASSVPVKASTSKTLKKGISGFKMPNLGKRKLGLAGIKSK